MRELVDAARAERFMDELGRAAREETTCYFAGGATAVLSGWRASTVDLDIRLDPEHDSLLRALPELKERLRVNVELASPADFIPLPPGWEDRSAFVARKGKVTFRHFDFVAQALSKLERGHARDVEDVQAMLARGLVDIPALRAAFEQIRHDLYRFPALDEATFEAAVEAIE